VRQPAVLGFIEEIVLLQLDDRRGSFVDLPQSAADVVIAGAALMELALHNRIDTDLERLIVVDARPTGDGILDGALAKLAASGNELNSAAAIELVTLDARKYQEQALQRLVEKGVLRQTDGRWRWVFHTRRYPVVDDREQREVKTRLRQVLLTEEIPDPRDVVLICLIDACGLLDLVLTPDEIAKTRPRAETLARLDLIGQAVTRAVAEIRFIVKHATTPIY
jgi:golgi phosphoprotein 3